jgi:hypothetical protein
MAATSRELVNLNSSAVVGYCRDSYDVSTEAEKFPLSDAVTRKHLIENVTD